MNIKIIKTEPKEEKGELMGMEDKIKAKKSGGETRRYTRGEYLVQGQARSNSGSSPPLPPNTHTGSNS